MKPKALHPWVPQKLDVVAFLDAQDSLSGTAPLSDMPRLAESLSPEADMAATSIQWSVQATLEAQRAAAPRRWMQVEAWADLAWTCQRCLTPVTLPVTVDRRILWVADEAHAASLDAEMEDDVLPLVKQLNVLSLVEDELIMASPLVPRHAVCPVPVTMSTDETATQDPQSVTGAEKESPFAVLANLKRSGKNTS